MNIPDYVLFGYEVSGSTVVFMLGGIVIVIGLLIDARKAVKKKNKSLF